MTDNRDFFFMNVLVYCCNLLQVLNSVNLTAAFNPFKHCGRYRAIYRACCSTLFIGDCPILSFLLLVAN
jgi:hypothetical protein